MKLFKKLFIWHLEEVNGWIQIQKLRWGTLKRSYVLCMLRYVARTFNDKILKVCIIISFFSVSSASISIFIGIYVNKKHQKEFLPKLKWQFNNVSKSKVWVPTNWRIFSEIHFYQNFQQTIHEWNKIVWLELGLSTL